jgi:5-methylcytosine-specific restriction endonuclease McrA
MRRPAVRIRYSSDKLEYVEQWRQQAAVVRPIRTTHSLVEFTAIARSSCLVLADQVGTVVSKEVFASCDYHLISTLKHWMGRRHGRKTTRWVFNKYCRHSVTGRLEFSTPAGLRLVHHADTPIQRHVKMRGTVSPFNGDIVYWSQRLRQHPLTTGRVANLLKRQQGRCAWSGSLLMARAAIEVDHVRPRIVPARERLSSTHECWDWASWAARGRSR